MTRRVVSVAPEASILDAIKLMLEHHVSGLPVIDHGRLTGIVTEGKVLVESAPGVRAVIDHLRWEGDVTPT